MAPPFARSLPRRPFVNFPARQVPSRRSTYPLDGTTSTREVSSMVPAKPLDFPSVRREPDMTPETATAARRRDALMWYVPGPYRHQDSDPLAIVKHTHTILEEFLVEFRTAPNQAIRLTDFVKAGGNTLGEALTSLDGAQDRLFDKTMQLTYRPEFPGYYPGEFILTVHSRTTRIELAGEVCRAISSYIENLPNLVDTRYFWTNMNEYSFREHEGVLERDQVWLDSFAYSEDGYCVSQFYIEWNNKSAV